VQSTDSPRAALAISRSFADRGLGPRQFPSID
jgi:hypothetical protein